MINEGLGKILQEPQNLDLSKVVPIFCETNDFSTIVDVCMRKVQYLKLTNAYQYLDINDQNK